MVESSWFQEYDAVIIDVLERQSMTEIPRVLGALLDNMWMIASDMSIEMTSLA